MYRLGFLWLAVHWLEPYWFKGLSKLLTQRVGGLVGGVWKIAVVITLSMPEASSEAIFAMVHCYKLFSIGIASSGENILAGNLLYSKRRYLNCGLQRTLC